LASSNRPVSGHSWSRTQTFCLSVLGAEEAVDFFAVGALRRADVAIIGRHRALLQRADGASRRFDHDVQAGDECHRACALPEAPLRRHCDRHDSISRPIMRSALPGSVRGCQGAPTPHRATKTAMPDVARWRGVSIAATGPSGAGARDSTNRDAAASDRLE